MGTGWGTNWQDGTGGLNRPGGVSTGDSRFWIGAGQTGNTGGAAGGSAQARAEADRARMMQLHGQQASPVMAGAATNFISGILGGQNLPYNQQTIAGMTSQAVDAAEGQRKAQARRAASGFASSGLGRGGGLTSTLMDVDRDAGQAKQAARTSINSIVHPANFAAQQQAVNQAQAQVHTDIARFQPEVDSLRQSIYQEEGNDPMPSVGGGGIGGGGSSQVRTSSPQFGATFGKPKGSYRQYTSGGTTSSGLKRRALDRGRTSYKSPSTTKTKSSGGWFGPKVPTPPPGSTPASTQYARQQMQTAMSYMPWTGRF